MFRRLSARIRLGSLAGKRAASKGEPAAQEDQSLKWLKAIHNAQQGPGSRTSGETLGAGFEAEPSLSPSPSESDFLCNSMEDGSEDPFFSPDRSPSPFQSDLNLSYDKFSPPESPLLSPSSEAASFSTSDQEAFPSESEPSTPDSCSVSGFEPELEALSPGFDPGVEDLNSFLQESKYRFEDCACSTPITFVMGNEAADLDSMVSAIAYARLLEATMSPSATVVVPLINIPRRDLPLRTEAAYLFSSMGLNLDALHFVDEVDLDGLSLSGRLRLVLVDHNRLASSQGHLQRSIVEIVDHHEPEDLYPWVEERLVEPVGSCCTLVAERISEQAPELLQGRGLNKLLLSAILLDTSNLDDSVGRSTESDEIMAALLVNGAGTLGRYGLFELLRAKRFDQSDLSTADLLRKDYKQWLMGPGMSVGISAVGLPLRKMGSKDENFKSEVKAFAARHDLGVLIIMSMFYDVMGNFKRQIAIVADDEVLVRDIAKFLASPDAGLRLTANPAAGFPDFSKVYNQTCLTASRKKVQPLLKEFFASRLGQ